MGIPCYLPMYLGTLNEWNCVVVVFSPNYLGTLDEPVPFTPDVNCMVMTLRRPIYGDPKFGLTIAPIKILLLQCFGPLTDPVGQFPCPLPPFK